MCTRQSCYKCVNHLINHHPLSKRRLSYYYTHIRPTDTRVGRACGAALAAWRALRAAGPYRAFRVARNETLCNATLKKGCFESL